MDSCNVFTLKYTQVPFSKALRSCLVSNNAEPTLKNTKVNWKYYLSPCASKGTTNQVLPESQAHMLPVGSLWLAEPSGQFFSLWGFLDRLPQQTLFVFRLYFLKTPQMNLTHMYIKVKRDKRWEESEWLREGDGRRIAVGWGAGLTTVFVFPTPLTRVDLLYYGVMMHTPAIPFAH